MVTKVALSATLAAASAFAAMAGQAAPAQRKDDAALARAAVEHGEGVPLPRILSIAQGRVRGEILKVVFEEAARQRVYKVKMLTSDGRICELKIDARVGRVLKIEDD